ncbi:ubiquitin-like protein-NEDD8-like protein RUB3 [Lolium perenne]|uniref:ubiquitin-like protein-NEDD8-like protein RUB3 n=1 Tax=Lolium perenne TaxID=4522 RepID=UPI0021F600C5|nr:ubiquitin-like protein-NEDD8-like protein RUB3 [Lolium perenne]
MTTISDVESSDTVESFRVRVQEQDGIGAKQRQGGIGIRPAWQRLLCGGTQMEDGHTLAAYGVRNEITMTLLVRWLVNYRTRPVELHMDVTDTVGRIKERVEKAEGVPVECQSLLLGAEELNDSRTLSHFIFETGTFVKIQCEREKRGAVTNTTTKGKGEEAPVIGKEVVTGDVTGPARKKNKGIPAPQWRRFVVHLLGPELAAICPSSCDTNPVY